MESSAGEPTAYPEDLESAVRHFERADRILFDLITEVGDDRPEPREDQSPFQALLRSIVYQQLSGKAAGSILNRVLSLYGGEFPEPRQLIATEFDQLRSCGLSQSKIRAVVDLAQKEDAGLLPTPSEVKQMTDSELIEAFTAVRGIGPWTVQMLLIFNLGRSDVLPTTDLGVRRGFKVAYGMDDLPSFDELARHGECWKPYRSFASWYLWRAADPNFRSEA